MADPDTENLPEENPGGSDDVTANDVGRRQVLKKLVVGGGVVAGAAAVLPERWDKPSIRRLASAASVGSTPAPGPPPGPPSTPAPGPPAPGPPPPPP